MKINSRLKRIIFVFGIIFVMACTLMAFVYNGVLWPVYPSLMGYRVKGIDVARYQGDIDWPIIAGQNIRFAFIKATEGSTYSDPLFERNIVGSHESGIAAGAYHFFSSESSGKTQAENFITVTSSFRMDLPPVLDFEISKMQTDSDRKKVISEAKIFLAELEKHYGIKPIIYATYESYNAFLTEDFTEYPLWLRDLLREPKVKGGQSFIFWQYCNRGRLKGIGVTQKYTDLNVFNGSQDEFEIYLQESKEKMH